MTIDIDIVCPIYKGSGYLEKLYQSFLIQKNVSIKNIIFPVTDSGDSEMDKIRIFVKQHNIIHFEIKPSDFSHSLTRQKAIEEYCSSKCVVMLSQDVELADENTLYNLVLPIHENKAVFCYARQISKYNNIEKYIRETNYPSESFYVTADDIEKKQLMAFFGSDSCSAYDRNVFLKIGGYAGYDVMFGEDMLYSKLIFDHGYTKKYCADAPVYHSHKFTLKQLYKRYYDNGVFLSQVKVFDKYKSTDSGFKLAFKVLGKALKHFNIPVLFRWLPDMAARYLGLRKGKKEGKIK